ncbi:Fic/DOC family protein [Adlercreutzia aquisgranensis]|uniref:Fic/DOC family protein n=1 Tax=Adlercreutzia aquisgranensis TaxID=2941323 RepID=UPI003D80F0F4
MRCRRPYVYAGTKVLINKLGLTNFDELWNAERAITGVAAAELEEHSVNGSFDLAHLQAIHRALFGEIYDWAGEIRKKGFISKGNSLFCGAEFIIPYSQNLFEALKAENYLRDLERGDFIERMAFYIAEINALHPFREGNGRTQRIFANQLARQAGWELNFKAVSPERLYEAYISSMVDMSDLIDLLNDTVSPKEN